MPLLSSQLRGRLLAVTVCFLSGALPAAAQLSWQWAQQANETSQTFYRQRVATDAAGNTYVVGTFAGPLTLGAFHIAHPDSSTEVFVASLDPAGHWRWLASGGSVDDDAGLGLAVSPAGEVFVSGMLGGAATFGNLAVAPSPNAATTSTAFVAKLSSTGQWQWAQRVGAEIPRPTRSYFYFPGWPTQALALDGSGNLYLTGAFAGTATIGSTQLIGPAAGLSPYLAKFDGSGGAQWVQQATPASGGSLREAVGTALTVDAAHNRLLWAGTYRGALTVGGVALSASRGGFVTQFDLAGQPQWVVDLQADSTLTITALAVTPAGRPVVAGSYTGTLGLAGATRQSRDWTSDVFVACLTDGGNLRWLASAGSPTAYTVSGTDYAQAVVATNDTVYVAGHTGGLSQFGAISRHQYGEGYFVAALDQGGGTWQWLRMTNHQLASTVHDLSRTAAGELVMVGTFWQALTLGPYVSLFTNATTMFVAKQGPAPLGLLGTAASGGFGLLPNPATGTAHLQQWPRAATHARLYSAVGQLVRTVPLPTGGADATLSLTGLAPGLYVVQVGDQRQRLVVE